MNSTLDSYDNIIHYIDDLIIFLKKIGAEADVKSHLENDYLIAHEFYEKYKQNPYALQNQNGRAALGGLYELYKWIWSVKDCEEFEKLNTHLKLLIQAAPRINSATPMISAITGKQDDKTNKFIEAIIGMFAVKYGSNVDLDDPINSSNGTNPDVMFNYNGNRVSIACKTLRSESRQTILDNLKSAAKQIERSECDLGYIVLNVMNILKHDNIKDKIFTTYQEPLSLLWNDIDSKYRTLRMEAEDELFEIFSGKKTRPIILTFVHSVALLESPLGNLSTSLKTTYATDFEVRQIDTSTDLELLSKINNFIHNR